MSIRLEKTQSSYQCFYRWITGGPIPAKLLVDTPEGEKTLVVDATAPRAWGKLHTALIAMGAVAVEGQNAAGEMLRRFDVTEVAEEEEPEATPSITLPMPASEDARMLSLFAQLLASAYKDGAASQRQSSDAAFKMLVQLAEGAFKRIDVLERALLRIRTGANPEDAPAAGGVNAGDLMGLVAQFMQGAQMAQQAKAAHATNGVHVPTSEGEPEEEETDGE